MGTRYVDRPNAMYLLVPTSCIARLHNDRDACLSAIDQSVPVSGGLDRMLEPAHKETLARAGVAEWVPRHTGISIMRPVDPTFLRSVGLTYCSRFGLRKDL